MAAHDARTAAVAAAKITFAGVLMAGLSRRSIAPVRDVGTAFERGLAVSAMLFRINVGNNAVRDLHRGVLQSIREGMVPDGRARSRRQSR